MVLESGEIVLWAAVFGLLVGIIWSLKYIVIINRRIEKLELGIRKMITRLEKQEAQELRLLKKVTKKKKR
jgi:hypothetical protein